jgi:hypothetical protein
MKSLHPLQRCFALFAFALAGLATTSAHASVEPAPGSYSARLDPEARQLHVYDPSGAVLQFQVSGCGEGLSMPTGLWLLSRDSQDRPVLLAPSATELPKGHPGAIAIVRCGEHFDGQALRLPAAILQTLEDHASAIFISE